MKTQSLIIDVREQLPWHKRYMSTTTTAMLWACWLFLWRPFVLVMSFIVIQKPHLLHHFFTTFGHVLENGFTALIACAVSLWLWSNFVPSKTKREAEDKSIEEYAHHFGLNTEHLLQARSQKISTVYHDADGHITDIR